MMVNDDNEFDVNSYKDFIDEDKIFAMWAKIEISRVLMKRARDLQAEVESDLSFYSLVNSMRED
jgi:hypothetical protein